MSREEPADHLAWLVMLIGVTTGLVSLVVFRHSRREPGAVVTTIVGSQVPLEKRSAESDAVEERMFLERLLTWGWVAEGRIGRVSDGTIITSESGGGGDDMGVSIVEFDVERWLRVDNSGASARRVVIVDNHAFEDGGIDSLSTRGIVIMMPYRRGEGLEKMIDMSETVARKQSTQMAEHVISGGWLVGWLPRTAENKFRFGLRGKEDVITISMIESVLRGKSSPERSELDRKVPVAQVSAAEVADLRATIDTNNAMRRERATATRVASLKNGHDGANMAPFFWPSRHNGPMNKQAAIEESIARVVPGKEVRVAFASLVKSSRALAVLGQSNGGSSNEGDKDVWFVGIVANGGIRRHEHVEFFSGQKMRAAGDESGGVKEVVGEYYIWNAGNSDLLQMGGLTTGFGINSDVEIIQKRLGE